MGAFDEQYIDGPVLDPAQQRSQHPRLPTVVAEVTGVQDCLSLGFDEEGDASEGRVIDRQRGDGRIADVEGLSRPDGSVPIPVQAFPSGQHRSRQHHLARPACRVDRYACPAAVDQSHVVEVGVAQQDRLRCRPFFVEESGDVRCRSIGHQFGGGLPHGRCRVERFPVGGDQWKAKVENQSGRSSRDFDAGAADLVRPTVDDDLHTATLFR